MVSVNAVGVEFSAKPLFKDASFDGELETFVDLLVPERIL